MSGGGNSGRLRSTYMSHHLLEMDRWTDEHHGYVVKTYYTNGESLVKIENFNIPRKRPLSFVDKQS